MADEWIIVNTAFDPHALGQHNSVFAISNGYLGLKGNLCEDRDGYQPVTLIHGVFDELDMFSLIRPSAAERRYLDPRYFDGAGKSPAVANLPNPLFVRVLVGAREIAFGRGGIRDFEQSLDLRSGEYRYRYDFRDAAGRTTHVEMSRFASLAHAHRVYMRFAVTPLDHSEPLRIDSGVDGSVRSNTTPERQYEIVNAHLGEAGACRLDVRTPARGHAVSAGVLTRRVAGPAAREQRGAIEHDRVYWRGEFDGRAGQTVALERCVVLTSSEDVRHRVSAPLDDELRAAAAQGYDAALAANRAAWDALWERSDVQIDGDPRSQRALRFCLFHLLAAAPRFSDRLSVPVKLLSGEYYQGNTFYDTDVYILPFYTFTQPALARACLNFRYEGLPPAREAARALGYGGAKLAWQSGPHGEECLGRWWRFTHTNIHINADVALALRQYLAINGDARFGRERGDELLVETARFYAARAQAAADGGYSLVDVAGPDEGHCESTDNFYTNYLAAWNLRWAAEAVERMGEGEGAARRLGLRHDEAARWREVADGLRLIYDDRTKVYEQCVGLRQLRPLPPGFLNDRKTWFETVFPYQALNQPDVLMAMALFRDEFAPDTYRANWDFYYDKSCNFSSMSFVINAICAADVGRLDLAYENFVISAGMDLDESLTGRKDTYAGLHGTAMGGAWIAAVCGFGGLHWSPTRGLRISPNLPREWSGLRFRFALQGMPVDVELERDGGVLRTGAGRAAPTAVRLCGRDVALAANGEWRIANSE